MSINIEVRYAASVEPFKQHHESPHETVGQLLHKALHAFGLLHDGHQYSLQHDHKTLSNLAETIGAVAGQHHHHLKLTLARQVVSG